MAKSEAAILISVLCIFCIINVGNSEDRFFVEGKVYCDTCRAQFFTRVSEYIGGAKVKLECRQVEGGSLTYSSEAVTDKSGIYRLPVDGDHEEEICEVSLVKSSRPDCEEIEKGFFAKQSARISLTKNNGISSPIRQANPLAFLKKEAIPECAKVLKELGFTGVGKLA